MLCFGAWVLGFHRFFQHQTLTLYISRPKFSLTNCNSVVYYSRAN
jgi:hypothetical protein